MMLWIVFVLSLGVAASGADVYVCPGDDDYEDGPWESVSLSDGSRRERGDMDVRNMSDFCCNPRTIRGKYALHPNGSVTHPHNGTITSFCIFPFYLDKASLPPEIKACLPNEPHTSVDVALLTAMSLSLVSIVLTVAAHVLLRRLGNTYGKTMVCFNVALFLLYTQAMTNICISNNNYICPSTTARSVIDFSYNYCLLAPFTWMSLISFDIFRKFRNLASTVSASKLFTTYSAIGWLLPLFLAILSHVDPTDPDIRYSLVPVAALLATNVTFFFLTTTTIYLSKKQTSSVLRGNDSSSHNSRIQYALYIRLFVITGVAWVAWLVRWAVKRAYGAVSEEQYLFTQLISASQGFFVFVATVCNGQTLTKIKKRAAARLFTTASANPSRTSTQTSEMSVSNNDVQMKPIGGS